MSSCPAPDGSSPQQRKFDAPFPMCIDVSKRYTVEFDTTMGNFVASLNTSLAPNTVNNFVCLARYHYYDGLIFHRVIKDFVLQGGCPEGTGRGGPGFRFADELPPPNRYEVGSLAMANAGPDTNGSQFFVISGASGVRLPPNYSLFGAVVSGLDVVEAIQTTPTDRQDRPQIDVVMNTVTITEHDD